MRYYRKCRKWGLFLSVGNPPSRTKQGIPIDNDAVPSYQRNIQFFEAYPIPE